MGPEEAFLLVATPDAPAAHRDTIVLIAVHGDEGSLGFVLNRPSELRMGEALSRLGVEALDVAGQIARAQVCRGGRTRDDVGWMLFDVRGTVMPPDDSCLLTSDIAVTASPDAVAEVVQQHEHTSLLLLLGHLTWEPGELEAELASGCWYRADPSARLVFDVPVERRWTEALCGTLGLSRPWLGQASYARA